MEEKKDILEKIAKQEENFEEKMKNSFDKIAILELDPEQKQKIAVEVKQNSKWDKLYWLEIFLSAAIATLWLIQNSVAVIIWAMLIAPLLRPINGVALWISFWEKKALLISLKTLFFSIIISIFVWYFLSFLVSFDLETTEILARTSPNILDFFIAIFSAFVAILSLQYSRLWESIAWVAMAASLLPPLVVSWIELYLKNYSLVWGSFMLFMTNLLAIILVWVFVFLLYWFSPHRQKNQSLMIKNLIFVIIAIIIIIIPLFQSLIKIKENIIYKKEISNYLEKILNKENKNIEISSLEIEKNSKKELKVKAIIKIPENIIFYKKFEDEIIENLKKKIWKNVNLKIELIRTANIISKDNIKIDTSKIIEKFIRKEIQKNKNINLINLEIDKVWEQKNIKIVYSIVKNSDFKPEILEQIEKNTKNNFNKEKLNFNFISLQEYSWKEIKDLKELFEKQSKLIDKVKKENDSLKKELQEKIKMEKKVVEMLKKYLNQKQKVEKVEEK